MVTSYPWQSEYEPLAFNTICSSPLEANKASFQAFVVSHEQFQFCIFLSTHTYIYINVNTIQYKWTRLVKRINLECLSSASTVSQQSNIAGSIAKMCLYFLISDCPYKVIKVQIIIQNTSCY